MIPFEKIQTIFFDYDGTIHDSLKLYAPAFMKAYSYLVQNGFANEREWTLKEISYWLGFSPPDMWRAFMPSLDEGIAEKCSSIIGAEMSKLICEKKPVLYEGAIETLAYLKDKGYKLVFLSNCKTYYRDYHAELFKLDKYFDELSCSEEYDFLPKYEILKRIRHRYPKEMVIIGDRKQDMEAGKKNDIYTIGCMYGFAAKGELKDANMVIDRINLLKEYF